MSSPAARREAVVQRRGGDRGLSRPCAPRRRTRQRRADRAGMTDLNVEHLEVRYGDLVGVADISLRWRPGRSSRCSAPTAPARPRRSMPSPAWCVRRAARIAWRGETISGKPAYAIVSKGLALSPEGWRLFVGQTVEQNLRLGATALADRSRIGALVRAGLCAVSRALPSGAASPPARCRAASGRCWRSAAR